MLYKHTQSYSTHELQPDWEVQEGVGCPSDGWCFQGLSLSPRCLCSSCQHSWPPAPDIPTNKATLVSLMAFRKQMYKSSLEQMLPLRPKGESAVGRQGWSHRSVKNEAIWWRAHCLWSTASPTAPEGAGESPLASEREIAALRLLFNLKKTKKGLQWERVRRRIERNRFLG